MSISVKNLNFDSLNDNINNFNEKTFLNLYSQIFYKSSFGIKSKYTLKSVIR